MWFFILTTMENFDSTQNLSETEQDLKLREQRRIYRLCEDCGKTGFLGSKDNYIVKNPVWAQYGNGKGRLCMECLEKSMGRKIVKDDIYRCDITEVHNPYTRSILNPDPIPLKLPKVGKNYFAFRGGNINKHSKIIVLVTDVVPFDQIDKKTLYAWERVAHSKQNLFDEETKYFVKAALIKSKKQMELIHFVKTFNNECGWLSFQNEKYRLDVDGSLAKSIKERVLENLSTNTTNEF